MKFKSIAVFAFCVLCASLSYAQTPVVVTNRANDAVPVKVTNDPAKRAHHVGFDLAFPPTGELPTVPAGQTFVVQHITGRFRTFNAFGAATCKFVELSITASPNAESAVEPYAIVPNYMGTGQGIAGDVNFFSISQPVTIYIAANSPIGPSFSLSSSCSAPIVQGRVVLAGYLVKSN